MYEDDEEIYDDAGDTGEDMSEPSGLSAIKARFEGAQNKFESNPAPGLKPGITPKPKVLPKYGGGGGLNICGAVDKKEGSIPNALRPKNAETDKPQDKPSETSSNGPLKKRDSKVNIPEAFRQKTDAPPVETKPKPGVKPSKWGSDSNNNAKVNGIPPAKNKDIIENAISQRKFGVGGAVKTSNWSQSPSGNVSPREKTADTNIPKTESDSPKQKSPRGVGTANDVLAKVVAMSGSPAADFKAKLRHVEPTKNSPSAVSVSPIKPVLRKNSSDSNDVPWRRNLKSAKLRERTKSVRTVIRVIDGKKFLKNDDSCLQDDSPPDKPDKLDCDIDIDALGVEYKEAMESLDTTEKVQHGWTEMEETYDDCGNLQSTRAVSLMGKRPKPKPRKSKKVPLIEPMTEDEELSARSWEEAGFNGLPGSVDELPAPPPELLDEQETYDDVGVAEVPPEEEELQEDEMYEELPEEPIPESSEPPPPPVGPKPPELPSTPLPKTPNIERSESESDNKQTAQQIVDAKEQKRIEKERKKKEKEEKKMLENKEKELKKLLKVLGHKVTAEILTTSVGKGKVKSNAKGKEKTGELTVTEGEEVDIIRMIDNPQGKWLVRILSSQKDKERGPYNPLELIGYCDEKNIEYMKGQKSSTSVAPAEEEQETYEDVDGAEDLEQDEIYEECN
ncbi:FYN-binding protein 1-like isoform X2 [Mercenaria mercenaria]|uniref:FYN-binding protein 1-like isoform X2 n=1 Tax=Mercenaria mercenaria TaxID=6596 RepID=UPI00234E5938|nr:FYN-binding protein 1-like isoform X2 [Mercenaria mercenaria]